MYSFSQFLRESIDQKELFKLMKEFGVSKSDIDSNGYITVYHGGKTLPKTIKPESSGGIFFLTNNYDTAQDYADMRKGKVFEIKVKPEDVNWNTGSYEIEIQDGGKIQNGIFYPTIKKLPKTKKRTLKVGDIVKDWGEVLEIFEYYGSIKASNGKRSDKVDNLQQYYEIDYK